MPSKNIVKELEPFSYYHVYNRGVAKQPIFKDDRDKNQLIKILNRHLDPSDVSKKNDGLVYRKFDKDLEINSFCLMGNHFHFLIYVQKDPRVLSEFLQAVLTAYTMYFNKRHARVGTLFQGVYKASRIRNENYLLHISRYIHLNPRTYKTYQWSSLSYYIDAKPPKWLRPERITKMFATGSYLDFLEDYGDHKLMLEEIKAELADR